QPGLAAVDARVAVGEVRPARADRLDLRAGEGEARLELAIDRVVEARLPVVGEHDLRPRRHRSGLGVHPGTVRARPSARTGSRLRGCHRTSLPSLRVRAAGLSPPPPRTPYT